MSKIREIKHHLNKPTEHYLCDVIARGPNWVRVLHVAHTDYRVGRRIVRAGSRTLARYERGSRYVRWDMFRPEGGPLGLLFHLCRNLDVRDDEVEYEDMILDVWVGPDGRAEVLDEDELQECVRMGRVSPEEAGELRELAAHIARRVESDLAT